MEFNTLKSLKGLYNTIRDNNRYRFHDLKDHLENDGELEAISIVDQYPNYPLILLHGYWNTIKVWTKFLIFFEQNRYYLGENLFLLDETGKQKPAIIDIRINAEKLKGLVESVLKITSAEKVILIGHSMGGLVARWYIEQLSGKSKVAKLIMLGTPNKGSKYIPMFSQIVKTFDDSLQGMDNSLQRLKHKTKNLFQKLEEKIHSADLDHQKKKQIMNITLNTEKKIETKLEDIILNQEIDHLGTAAAQMEPGSEFLETLGYEAHSNYYLIAGTAGLPGIFLPDGVNDGCVHLENAKLQNLELTHFKKFNINHYQLHENVAVFNQIMKFIFDS